MLVTVKKKVESEETIELKTPCWLVNRLGFYAHITEAGDLIEVFGSTITLRDTTDPATEAAISNVLTCFSPYHACAEDEFKEALDTRLLKLENIYTKA